MKNFKMKIASVFAAMLCVFGLTSCGGIGETMTRQAIKEPTLEGNVLRVELSKKETESWYQLKASTVGINIKERLDKSFISENHIDVYLRESDTEKNTQLKDAYDFQYVYNEDFTVEGEEKSFFPVEYGSDDHLAAGFSLDITKIIERAKTEELPNRLFDLEITLQKTTVKIPLVSKNYVLALNESGVASLAYKMNLSFDGSTESFYMALNHTIEYTKDYSESWTNIYENYSSQQFSVFYKDLDDEKQIEKEEKILLAETKFINEEGAEPAEKVFNIFGKKIVRIALSKDIEEGK